MEDDEKLVEKVAREIVDQHGTDAVEILLDSEDGALKKKSRLLSGPICSRDSSHLAGSAWASWCGGAESFEPCTG